MPVQTIDTRKGIVLHTLKLAAFLMLFFQLGRLCFMGYHGAAVWQNQASEIASVFSYSIRLDLSSCSYLMAIPVLLYFLLLLTRLSFFNALVKGYFVLILVLVNAITSFEVELYAEWGTKLNYRALKYLNNPAEPLQAASNAALIWGVVFFVGQSWLSLWFFLKKIHSPVMLSQPHRWFALPYLLAGCTVLVVGIRGGLQQIPINQGQCYFSKSNVLNLAATNSFWNLLNNLFEHSRLGTDRNPYQFYTRPDARKTTDELLAVPTDTTIKILTTSRPNVVLVVLESWSADIVKACGGDSGITPGFERLASQGVLFTNCYASGERSDQGMAAIFSAFPAQPEFSILSHPDKMQRLPSIVRNFEEAGYFTSFLYGGQLIFGGIRGYMVYNGFDVVKEDNDFGNYPRGKMGMHDQDILNEFLNHCNQSEPPFFNAVFTQSTHSPYDQPRPHLITKGGRHQPYLSAARYSDSCLAVFMQQASRQPWFQHTLFVFVADHAHFTHMHEDNFSASHHKIPMLFFGPVIKPEYRGYRYTHVVPQHGLAATLLAQLGMSHKAYYWSPNLFNPHTRHHAYAASNQGGFVWVAQDGNSYAHFANPAMPNPLHSSTWPVVPPAQLKQGRAYLQEVYQQFIDY